MKFEVEIDTKDVVKDENKAEFLDRLVILAGDYFDKKYPNMVADISAMIKVNYIKAKYQGSARDYTFKTTDTVVAGDTVTTVDGKHLEVVGMADMEWVNTYGADKIKEVKKVDPTKAESEEK